MQVWYLGRDNEPRSEKSVSWAWNTGSTAGTLHSHVDTITLTFWMRAAHQKAGWLLSSIRHNLCSSPNSEQLCFEPRPPILYSKRTIVADSIPYVGCLGSIP